MFAILSGIKEGGMLPSQMGWSKNVLSGIAGMILFLALPRSME